MNQNRKTPLDPLLLSRARGMRHDPAPAEQKLWAILRNRQFGGWKFRRQVPMGNFIADFYCHELALVVELDGESHVDRRNQDEIRTEILERDGHRVIRFWNPDVFENLPGVLESLYAECERIRAREPPHPDPLPKGEGETLARAADILREGGVIAFPTETVYGLGADATNASAIARVFQIKGRPATNPLIVHVADEQIARRYARDWPLAASRLVDRFWPGPLTIVLPKAASIVASVTAGLDTVALRAPNHPLTLELLRAFDGPLAGPSANRSTHISPTSAEHVREELGDEVDLILDGGPCAVGIESTVLDVTSEVPTILRLGGVSREAIERVVGVVRVATTTLAAEAASPAKSPGQQAKHYAPRAPAVWFHPPQRDRLDLRDARVLEIDASPTDYARHFYARLRALDRARPRAIYIEMPPDQPQWAAVRDRILRAARPLSDG